MSSPIAQQVRVLLEKYGTRAKKSWGQNFLIDERAYEAIVRTAQVGPDDHVLEIGAGLGTLTSQLLSTGAQVTAVERDREMCEVLRGEVQDHPRFHLREENALTLDMDSIGDGVVLVGNLPYQIAAPLLFHFLAGRAHIKRLVLMFQREVADRLLAGPGKDAYSALSAQVQMVAQVRRVCHVGARGFLPPPRVDSTVVLIVPGAVSEVPVRSLERYSQVVRAAFGQRRKTLKNALAAAFGEHAEPALRSAGIDPTRRGETLDIREFARLADALEEAQIA